jgi:hypothetical protein
MTAPYVEIRRNGRSGFAVALASIGGALESLIPPLPYPDHGRASYAARALGAAVGWPVIDRTTGARP